MCGIIASAIHVLHYPVRSGKTQLLFGSVFPREHANASIHRAYALLKTLWLNQFFGVGGAAGAGNLFVRPYVRACVRAEFMSVRPSVRTGRRGSASSSVGNRVFSVFGRSGGCFFVGLGGERPGLAAYFEYLQCMGMVGGPVGGRGRRTPEKKGARFLQERS